MPDCSCSAAVRCPSLPRTIWTTPRFRHRHPITGRSTGILGNAAWHETNRRAARRRLYALDMAAAARRGGSPGSIARSDRDARCVLDWRRCWDFGRRAAEAQRACRESGFPGRLTNACPVFRGVPSALCGAGPPADGLRVVLVLRPAGSACAFRFVRGQTISSRWRDCGYDQ